MVQERHFHHHNTFREPQIWIFDHFQELWLVSIDFSRPSNWLFKTQGLSNTLKDCTNPGLVLLQWSGSGGGGEGRIPIEVATPSPKNCLSLGCSWHRHKCNYKTATLRWTSNSPDHGLWHLLCLHMHILFVSSRVRVKQHLGEWQFPQLKIRQRRQAGFECMFTVGLTVWTQAYFSEML